MQQLPGGSTGKSNPLGPLWQALAFLLAVALLVTSFFLGLVLFAVFLGLFAIGLLIMTLRIWWFNRKIRKAVAEGRVDQTRSSVTIIEGSYRREDDR